MTIFKDHPVRLFDLSYHQDDYDTPYKPTLGKMIDAGFVGIMIRVGWGLVIDRMFSYFWAQAKGKLERMPYWYLDYYSHKGKMSAEEWGAQQADKCWSAVKSDTGEMKLALDCEEFGGAWRITYLNRGDYQAVMRGFLQRWKKLTGAYPIIYCSPGFIWVFEAWAKELDLWVAIYNRNINQARAKDYAREKGWKGKVLFWQYTSDGDVDDDGIPDGKRMGFETDALDLNLWLGSMEEYSAYCGDSLIPPQLPPAEDDEPIPPVVMPAGSMTVTSVSGLNIRDVPIGKAGSQVIGWMPKGTVVTPLEIVQVGVDIWARLDTWSCAAVRYNGVEMMR